MKHITTAALMLIVSSVGGYAQAIPAKMKLSGTNVATTINLQPNTVTDEHLSAGDGTFGPFTFRELHADLSPAPQAPPGCSGPNFAVVSGGGVFRFQDGSLLIVTLTNGSGCVNPTAGTSDIAVQYQITGGTGRFEGASGTLNFAMTQKLVFRAASNAPALLIFTGEVDGTVCVQP